MKIKNQNFKFNNFQHIKKIKMKVLKIKIFIHPHVKDLKNRKLIFTNVFIDRKVSMKISTLKIQNKVLKPSLNAI